MSEPFRTPSSPSAGTEAEREELIEKLLLAGLDHYFEGSYEQAVNVWTRVAFLERGHGRARAYIERARGALAERQREAEELANAGVAAYNAGELQTARDLLTRATSTGSASDTAQLFIERLQRLDAAAGIERPAAPPARLPAAGEPGAGSQPRAWALTVTISIAIAAFVLLSSLRVASWLAERPIGGSTAPAVTEPLPLVRSADL